VTVPVTRRADAPRPEPPEGYVKVVGNGKSTIRLKHASTGGTLIVLEVLVPKWVAVSAEGKRKRVNEEIPFRDGNARRTRNFAKDVGRHMEGYGLTVKRCSETCHTTPQVVKDIDLARLRKRYGDMRPTHYSANLVIDEFMIQRPMRFATQVLDADTGELLYLEKGKGKAQALHFFDWVGEDFMSHVKAVSMDMNTNYSVAFVERYPQVDVVWDPFHVHQWFNKGLDSARRTESNRLKREADKKREAGDDEAADELMAERKLLFGQRFNLLANKRTLKAKDALNAELNREAKEQARRDGRNPDEVGRRRTDNLERLQTLLDTNDKLNALLRAREELQDALALDDPSEMRRRLEEWVATWSKAGISQLTRFTKTIAKRMDGIVARAEHHISSGIIEGANTLVLCPAFYYCSA
jgi:transposase